MIRAFCSWDLCALLSVRASSFLGSFAGAHKLRGFQVRPVRLGSFSPFATGWAASFPRFRSAAATTWLAISDDPKRPLRRAAVGGWPGTPCLSAGQLVIQRPAFWRSPAYCIERETRTSGPLSTTPVAAGDPPAAIFRRPWSSRSSRPRHHAPGWLSSCCVVLVPIDVPAGGN